MKAGQTSFARVWAKKLRSARDKVLEYFARCNRVAVAYCEFL